MNFRKALLLAKIEHVLFRVKSLQIPKTSKSFKIIEPTSPHYCQIKVALFIIIRNYLSLAS